MKLAYKLDSLDGLDEALKPLYVKEGDKFVLQVDDSGASSAIRKERERAEVAERALKAEADHKAAKEREELERKGEYEKLSAADKAALKAAEERAATLEAKIRNGERDRALMEAMSDAAVRGIPKALLPHIQDQVEVVPDGEDFKVVPKGNPALKLTEFVSAFKKDMPWGFEASGASGGGADSSGRTAASGKAISLSELNALEPKARIAHFAAGGILTE